MCVVWWIIVLTQLRQLLLFYFILIVFHSTGNINTPDISEYLMVGQNWDPVLFKNGIIIIGSDTLWLKSWEQKLLCLYMVKTAWNYNASIFHENIKIFGNKAKWKEALCLRHYFIIRLVWCWSFNKMRKDGCLLGKMPLSPSVLNIVITNTTVGNIAGWKKMKISFVFSCRETKGRI